MGAKLFELQGVSALTKREADVVIEAVSYILDRSAAIRHGGDLNIPHWSPSRLDKLHSACEKLTMQWNFTYGRDYPAEAPSRGDAKLKAEEEHIIATTCFHCGAPAIPSTHGRDPRCERHHDV